MAHDIGKGGVDAVMCGREGVVLHSPGCYRAPVTSFTMFLRRSSNAPLS